MKKFLKIFSVTILLLVAAVIILPYAFRGKITELVKEEINKSVNARVDFAGVDLGLLRSFPDFSIRITDLSVLGNEPFENDTLFFTKNFELKLDITSLFQGSPYEIKNIVLNEPRIRLIALADGRQNWEITLGEDDAEPEIPDEESEDFDLGVGLRSFEIKNAAFVYDDRSTPMYVSMSNLNSKLSGDFSLDRTQLHLAMTVASINSVFDDMTVAKNVSFKLETDVDADLTDNVYTVKTENLFLNALEMAVDGRFTLGDSDIGIDFKFDAPRGTFKQLLSLVPAEFMKDYTGLKADGNFSLNAFLKGNYSENTFPAFGVQLAVNNGKISYPEIPEPLDNIRLAMAVDNKSGDFDETTIRLNPLQFSIKENPFELNLTVQTPVSNPQIAAKMKGKLVLESLAPYLPDIDIQNLKGDIDLDLAVRTSMSDIENEKYEQIEAAGSASLTRFSSTLEGWDEPLTIKEADLFFSPKLVKTDISALQLGNSDFHLSGEVTDYLGYVLSDGTLKGSFNMKSNIIDTDELMQHFSSEEDTSALSLDFLPERIDIRFNANANTITFQQYELKNAKAGIAYADKKITFNPLQANTMGGQLKMAGSLDAVDAKSPLVDLDFNINNFDIPTAYKTIGLFQAAAPIAEKAKGNFSTNFNLKGKLDEELSPVFGSLQGGGGLATSKLQIDSVPAMDQLASLLDNNNYKQLAANAVNVNFEFVNGRVYQKPFNLSYAGSDMTMSGSLGFDQSLDYSLIFNIPFGKLGKKISDGIAGLVTQSGGLKMAADKEVQVKALISGTVTSPKITLDYKDYAQDLKNQLTKLAQDKLNEEKAALEKKAREEAAKLIQGARDQGNKLIAEADAAAQSIRGEAAKAAGLIRNEADKGAEKLITEGKAKGMIAQKLAEEAAKKLRSEANQKASKLETEADKKASALQTAAKNKADSLIKEAQRLAGNP